jgi:hypothetical protein
MRAQGRIRAVGVRPPSDTQQRGSSWQSLASVGTRSRTSRQERPARDENLKRGRFPFPSIAHANEFGV